MTTELQKRCLDALSRMGELNSEGLEQVPSRTYVAMLLFHTINLHAHLVEWDDVVKLVESWMNSLGVEERTTNTAWHEYQRLTSGYRWNVNPQPFDAPQFWGPVQRKY